VPDDVVMFGIAEGLDALVRLTTAPASARSRGPAALRATHQIRTSGRLALLGDTPVEVSIPAGLYELDVDVIGTAPNDEDLWYVVTSWRRIAT